MSGGYKHFLGKSISKQLEEKIAERETIIASRGEKSFISVIEEDSEEYQQEALTPIICEGDVIGAVVILENDGKTKLGEVEHKLIM